MPGELGYLSSLQVALNLSYNNLSGTIPLELGKLSLLEVLLLNNNHLNGEIPTTFESLLSLVEFNFSYNNLTGPLPAMKLFKNMTSCSFTGNPFYKGNPFLQVPLPKSCSPAGWKPETSIDMETFK
ncbi:hypothetical protein PTKIN_Ptkin09bG0214900 [Pterospermum kingtungense]